MAKHRGAQKGNKNAQKRKPLKWPEGNKWQSKEDLEAFMLYTAEEYAKQNPHDTRSQGALNNTVRIYAELKGWIQKTPINIIQAQTVVKNETDWKKLFEQTPTEERLVVARFIKRLADSENSPSQS
jgi:hypothetical protein